MVELECIFDQDKSTHNKWMNEEKIGKECHSYYLGTKNPKMVRVGRLVIPMTKRIWYTYSQSIDMSLHGIMRVSTHMVLTSSLMIFH